jgi:hypothetical protein
LDIYGKEIHSFNANGPGINNVQENLSSKLPTGIYYLKVATDNQMEVSKLIIE